MPIFCPLLDGVFEKVDGVSYGETLMAYGLARISILSGTSLDQLITRRSGGSEPKRRRWRMKRGERVRKQGVLRPMGARRLCFRVGNEKSPPRNQIRTQNRAKKLV